MGMNNFLKELQDLWSEVRQLQDGFMNGDPNFTPWDHSVRDRSVAFSFKIEEAIKGATMTYKVAIRDNTTGEVRVREMSLDWKEHSAFWWRRGDGNMGCDCNRRLEFERAAGGEPGLDQPCGHSRYDVLYVELPDGHRLHTAPDLNGEPF